jgi:hypothetical protein
MYLAAILATALITLPAYGGKDATYHISSDDPAQAPAGAEESASKPAADPATTTAPDARQPDNKQAETPSDKKADAPAPKKKPGAQSSAVTHKRRARTKKPALTTTGEPRKVVIHRGGATEPVTQILPGMSQEEASHQRETAEELLAATESSVEQLSERSLNANQQETVVQIRQYMGVARSALKESDTQRAHTLALKAYLLSDDLVKHEK